MLLRVAPTPLLGAAACRRRHRCARSGSGVQATRPRRTTACRQGLCCCGGITPDKLLSPINTISGSVKARFSQGHIGNSYVYIYIYTYIHIILLLIIYVYTFILIYYHYLLLLLIITHGPGPGPGPAPPHVLGPLCGALGGRPPWPLGRTAPRPPHMGPMDNNK